MEIEADFTWWRFVRKNYIETLMSGCVFYEYMTFLLVFAAIDHCRITFMVHNIELSGPLYYLVTFSYWMMRFPLIGLFFAFAFAAFVIWRSARFYRQKLESEEKEYWQAYGVLYPIGLYVFIALVKWAVMLLPNHQVQSLMDSVG